MCMKKLTLTEELQHEIAVCLAHYIEYVQFKKKLERMDKFSGLAYFQRARDDYQTKANKHHFDYMLTRTILENKLGFSLVDQIIGISYEDWQAINFKERAEEFTKDFMCDSLGCSSCKLFNFEGENWCKKYAVMPEQLFARCPQYVQIQDSIMD